MAGGPRTMSVVTVEAACSCGTRSNRHLYTACSYLMYLVSSFSNVSYVWFSAHARPVWRLERQVSAPCAYVGVVTRQGVRSRLGMVGCVCYSLSSLGLENKAAHLDCPSAAAVALAGSRDRSARSGSARPPRPSAGTDTPCIPSSSAADVACPSAPRSPRPRPPVVSYDAHVHRISHLHAQSAIRSIHIAREAH
jgi:hypothetical protein